MKIKGTVLVPGISRNGRYYSAPMIADAVKRAQPRVASGRMIMRSHHDSGDDPTHVVGRVTGLKVGESGQAEFEAELADTPHGRTVGQLMKGPRPFLDGVSLTGQWVGPVKRVTVGGQPAETADSLDLRTIDMTLDPGVDGARVVAVAESFLSGKGTRLIFESAPGPAVPVTPELDARQLAGLTSEERDGHMAQQWTAFFAGRDARRQAQGPSPFWRGLDQAT